MIGPAADSNRERHQRHARSIGRLLALAIILFLVTPAVAIGLSGWWFLDGLGSSAKAAAEYKAAAQCDPGLPLVPCYLIEKGQLLALTRIPGKCGSRYDRLSVRLESGTYQTDISFDCLASWVDYANAAGQVTVKLFDGRITEVATTDGTMLETTGAPGGNQPQKGLFIVVLAFCGPWLLFNLFVLLIAPRLMLAIWHLLVGQSSKPTAMAA
jgi:hypothetical protein